MYKLNFKKRVWIVKQKLSGVSTSKIALVQKISPRTVQVLLKVYKEASGVIVTKDGISIEKKKYLVLGQDKYIPIISASAMEIAQELIRKIR